ncbi:MAG: membrane protein insertion efficiency factor YidD [Candidatus Bipolaricaulota bacterium]
MLRRLVILPLRGYQRLVSPFLPHRCRFYPSCSQYAVEAIGHHGVLRGGWLALRRLARCHPFHPGGVDLVPPRKGEPPDAPSSIKPTDG